MAPYCFWRMYVSCSLRIHIQIIPGMNENTLVSTSKRIDAGLQAGYISVIDEDIIKIKRFTQQRQVRHCQIRLMQHTVTISDKGVISEWWEDKNGMSAVVQYLNTNTTVTDPQYAPITEQIAVTSPALRFDNDCCCSPLANVGLVSHIANGPA